MGQVLVGMAALYLAAGLVLHFTAAPRMGDWFGVPVYTEARERAPVRFLVVDIALQPLLWMLIGGIVLAVIVPSVPTMVREVRQGRHWWRRPHREHRWEPCRLSAHDGSTREALREATRPWLAAGFRLVDDGVLDMGGETRAARLLLDVAGHRVVVLLARGDIVRFDVMSVLDDGTYLVTGTPYVLSSELVKRLDQWLGLQPAGGLPKHPEPVHEVEVAGSVDEVLAVHAEQQRALARSVRGIDLDDVVEVVVQRARASSLWRHQQGWLDERPPAVQLVTAG